MNFNEFKKSLNGKTINQLTNDALEIERGLRVYDAWRLTGQAPTSVKVLGVDWQIETPKKNFNAGLYRNLRRMRAIILTRISEKQRRC